VVNRGRPAERRSGRYCPHTHGLEPAVPLSKLPLALGDIPLFLIPGKFGKFGKFDPGPQAPGICANDSRTLRSSEIGPALDHIEQPVITIVLPPSPPEAAHLQRLAPPERSGTP
jgi:hypothetical protein